MGSVAGSVRCRRHDGDGKAYGSWPESGPPSTGSGPSPPLLLPGEGEAVDGFAFESRSAFWLLLFPVLLHVVTYAGRPTGIHGVHRCIVQVWIGLFFVTGAMQAGFLQ